MKTRFTAATVARARQLGLDDLLSRAAHAHVNNDHVDVIGLRDECTYWLQRFGYEHAPQPSKLQRVLDGLGVSEDTAIALICAAARKEG